jgi:predicted dehydrogenase
MNNKYKHIPRRKFLKTAAVSVAIPYILPSSVVSCIGREVPSKRLTLGLIGLGSMGMRHLKGFLQEEDCRIVGVCDVDASRLSAAAGEINKHYKNNDCAEYRDFRELVARDDVDTLCISVPDHWHAIIALAGILAGKDIYGEKPLTLTITEGQALVEAVNRYQCVWQTGSWQRSTSHFRFGCELVRN